MISCHSKIVIEGRQRVEQPELSYFIFGSFKRPNGSGKLPYFQPL